MIIIAATIMNTQKNTYHPIFLVENPDPKADEPQPVRFKSSVFVSTPYPSRVEAEKYLQVQEVVKKAIKRPDIMYQYDGGMPVVYDWFYIDSGLPRRSGREPVVSSIGVQE